MASVVSCTEAEGLVGAMLYPEGLNPTSHPGQKIERAF